MSPMRTIRVVSYRPKWYELFQVEAVRIKAILGQQLIAIHHIGSTSVRGLSAKPIIDIMPLVRCIEAVDQYNDAFIALGYRPYGENGIPGRRFFVKGPNYKRTHHIHTYELHHPEVARHLDFRDYLRAHPDFAHKYGQLKIKLAQQFPHDIDGYIRGKSPFINDVIKKARGWHRGNEGCL